MSPLWANVVEKSFYQIPRLRCATLGMTEVSKSIKKSAAVLSAAHCVFYCFANLSIKSALLQE
jgi:hypothetical protein